VSAQFRDILLKTTATEKSGDLRAQTPCRLFLAKRIAEDLPGLLLHASPMRFGSALQSNFQPVFKVSYQQLRHTDLSLS
jgi:hypothetical protein